jgi:hypothetical protein
MAISFSCDCGQEFKVSDSHAGKRIKCQGCGNPVKIPQLKTGKSNSDSGAVAVGKAAKKKRAVDEEEDPLVHSASEYDSASEFDIGNVPLGKLIEEEAGAPGGKNGKKKSKKSGGEAAAEKPKKKKRKDEDAANPIVIGLFLVLGLCSLSALGYFGFQKMGGAVDKTPLEKKYVKLEGPEKVWSFERPEDWTVEQMSGGTGGKPPVVLISGDDAIFRIKGSMGGSAIGSIAQAGGAGGIAVPGADAAVGGGDDLSPETAVHEFQKELFKADYSEFDEEPMQKLKMPYGEGRLSIFTAKEGFLSPKIKGYRVTFSDNNWQYNLRAYAPEGQWEKYQPIFKKMIDSISR